MYCSWLVQVLPKLLNIFFFVFYSVNCSNKQTGIITIATLYLSLSLCQTHFLYDTKKKKHQEANHNENMMNWFDWWKLFAKEDEVMSSQVKHVKRNEVGYANICTKKKVATDICNKLHISNNKGNVFKKMFTPLICIND